MARIDQRWPDNAEGPYYVDRDCVLCHVCHEVAPGIFEMSPDGDHMVVARQPGGEEERALAEQALEGCPMDAVGRDGESATG